MSTVTAPATADRPEERARNEPRDRLALTGGLFVLAVVGAFIAGGDTPDGDASAATVIAHYTENRTQGIIASVLLALSAVPALAFAARLRERARIGSHRTLADFTFAAGVVTAMGCLGVAGIHLALAEYARDLDPAAAQALNALDADSFVALATGIAALVLGGSLIALRNSLLPAWLGWTGIPVAIAIFIPPVGFFAACLGGIWIITSSVLLYAHGEEPHAWAARDGAGGDAGADTGSNGTPVRRRAEHHARQRQTL